MFELVQPLNKAWSPVDRQANQQAFFQQPAPSKTFNELYENIPQRLKDLFEKRQDLIKADKNAIEFTAMLGELHEYGCVQQAAQDATRQQEWKKLRGSKEAEDLAGVEKLYEDFDPLAAQEVAKASDEAAEIFQQALEHYKPESRFAKRRFEALAAGSSTKDTSRENNGKQRNTKKTPRKINIFEPPKSFHVKKRIKK